MLDGSTRDKLMALIQSSAEAAISDAKEDEVRLGVSVVVETPVVAEATKAAEAAVPPYVELEWPPAPATASAADAAAADAADGSAPALAAKAPVLTAATANVPLEAPPKRKSSLQKLMTSTSFSRKSKKKPSA